MPVRYLPFLAERDSPNPIATLLDEHLIRGGSVLNIGTARHVNTGTKLYGYYQYAIGMDVHYVDKVNEMDDFVKGYAPLLPFRNNSFDVVIAIELIEHLTKEDGYILLEEMEQIAKRQIVVSTPNGFLKIVPKDRGYGSPFDAHLSGWTKKEFEDIGFKVFSWTNRMSLFRQRTMVEYESLVCFKEVKT